MILLISGALYLAAPWLVSHYQITGWAAALLRFICLAAGLRFLMSLETLGAAAAGRDLESREHYRSLFFLALVYSLSMLLLSLGGIALII